MAWIRVSPCERQGFPPAGKSLPVLTTLSSRLKEKGIALNYSTFVGQGTIRGAAMGFNDRPPKGRELEIMKALVEENIQNGALGLSSGLEYAPGSYALPDEIVVLCKVATENIQGIWEGKYYAVLPELFSQDLKKVVKKDRRVCP